LRLYEIIYKKGMMQEEIFSLNPAPSYSTDRSSAEGGYPANKGMGGGRPKVF
jgi:hypothetical protein